MQHDSLMFVESMSMVVLSRDVSGIQSIVLENFSYCYHQNNNNYTIDSKLDRFEIDMWLYIPHYDSVMPIYYTSLSSVK